MAIKAEYIWIDGTEPTAAAAVEDQDPRRRRRACRSGASTARAPTRRRATAPTACSSRCSSCPDPIRGGDNMLVMCEVLLTDMTPHPTNTRAALRRGRREVRRPGAAVRHRAGVHVLQGRPPARLPGRRLPGAAGLLLLRRRRRRGVRPRRSSRRTSTRCLDGRPRHLRHQRRGHARPVGVPGRPARPARGRRPAVGRPLAALPHRRGLRRRGHARPEAGQGRLERRRRAHQLLDQGDARGLRRRSSPRARRSARRPSEHVANYGHGIEDRLTGPHETAPWNEFSYGVSDRGASVRIPWQVEVDKKGYIEDRRPNANMDPYVVTRLITDTVCSAAS